jgi:hypothetical protein
MGFIDEISASADMSNVLKNPFKASMQRTKSKRPAMRHRFRMTENLACLNRIFVA